MLLDSASLYFRAFHGVPESVTAPDGTPVNSVRGFIDMIAFLVRRRRPDRLVACLDLDWRPAFRVAAVPSYKAHRVSPRGGETVPDGLVPQIPVYFISLPFVITGGLLLLYFAVPTMLSLFADGFVDVTIGR